MTTSSASIAEAIERFVRVEFQVSDRDPTFARDVNLFDGGFVDSIGLVQLISFLESTFHIAVEDEALMSDDFATVNGISRVVAASMARRP